MLRVVGAGVCGVWYHRGYGKSSNETQMEEEDSAIAAAMPADVTTNPTLAFVKQAMTDSFGSVALAALLASDWRTSRAIFGSLRHAWTLLVMAKAPPLSQPQTLLVPLCRDRVKDSKSCLAASVRWIVFGLDKIVHYFNFYSYTQV